MASTAVQLPGFFLGLLGFAGAAAATPLLPQRRGAASVGTSIIIASGNGGAVGSVPVGQQVNASVSCPDLRCLCHSTCRYGWWILDMFVVSGRSWRGHLFSPPWCALPGNSRLDYKWHDYGFLQPLHQGAEPSGCVPGLRVSLPQPNGTAGAAGVTGHTAPSTDR